MANDTKTKKGFGNHARAAAISRFLKKHVGVETINEGSTGLEGIRVQQDNPISSVWLRVRLDDEAAAAAWTREIADKLEANGYKVTRHDSSLSITCDDWQLDDQIGRLLFGFSGREALIDDAGMLAATDHVVKALRDGGLVEQETRALTELGRTFRARLILQRNRKQQAEKRRIRSRGW
jgi:hypothetical protein